MSTRLYLICYDIADERRLRTMHRIVSENALMLQYSVYLTEGTEASIEELAEKIRLRCDPGADDVRIYPLPEQPAWMHLGYDPDFLSFLWMFEEISP